MHEHHVNRSCWIWVLIVLLFSMPNARASCWLGAGTTFFHQGGFEGNRPEVISLGCELHHYDFRTTYFGAQDVTRTRPWGAARFMTDAHLTVAAMRVWRFFARTAATPLLGAGLNFQKGDTPRDCVNGNQPYSRLKYTCRGNPYVPLPVEFAFKAGLTAEHWSVSLNHVSNARLVHYNFGQNYLQLEYHW